MPGQGAPISELDLAARQQGFNSWAEMVAYQDAQKRGGVVAQPSQKGAVKRFTENLDAVKKNALSLHPAQLLDYVNSKIKNPTGRAGAGGQSINQHERAVAQQRAREAAGPQGYGKKRP